MRKRRSVNLFSELMNFPSELIAFGLVGVLLVIVLIASPTIAVDNGDATRVLTAAGYTEIQITGYNYFACSEDDFYHTGFKAIGPTGQEVVGTVCKGWFKGSTIRFD